jgi:hypothetical protein
MARYASPDLAARLLRIAGISDEIIVSIARKVDSDRLWEAAPLVKKGKAFLIPRVEKRPDGLKDLGTSILMDVELVPNPASTYCFGISFTPGQFDQWAIVDTSEAEAEGLGPFWGLPVLIEFAPSDRPQPLRPVGLEVGTLYLEEGEETPEGIPWFVRFLQSHIGGLLLGASARIGMWIESREARVAATLESERNDSAARGEAQPDASRVLNSIRSGRASRAIKLSRGCKIIGRVITWWYAIQEPGRRTLEGLTDQVRPSDSRERKG